MRNAPVSEKAPVGVFVGLATLDVIHRIAKAPAVNQKVTSTAQFVAAGGPAANAAVTFAALGGDAIYERISEKLGVGNEETAGEEGASRERTRQVISDVLQRPLGRQRCRSCEAGIGSC